jgi:hypothetical protein
VANSTKYLINNRNVFNNTNCNTSFVGCKLISCLKHGILLAGTGEQPENGSPVSPGKQVHTGPWFTTRQIALGPQDPGQGSLQRSI